MPPELAAIPVTQAGEPQGLRRERLGRLRLGVNIDHVATIRNARGGDHPDPVRAAEIVAAVGGDGITAHLREDRRHIRDERFARASRQRPACRSTSRWRRPRRCWRSRCAHKPHAACIVPEKREERTTEGGLDAAGQHNQLAPIVARLADAGIRVSLFIEPDERQLEAAMRLRAPVVEFHTGEYAHADGERVAAELHRIADMAALAVKNGIEPHAGHGLTFDNVQPIAAIPQLAELNIGHYLVGEAVFVGLEEAVRADARVDGRRAQVHHRPRLRPLQYRADPATLSTGSENVSSFAASPMSSAPRRRKRPFTRAGTYAKRFAAKEAFSKAVGTGFRRGVFMKDIGVVNAPPARRRSR